MRGTAHLTINGKTVSANIGMSLLEAGLQGGIAMPKDCCSGDCGTCRVDVLSGTVDPAGMEEAGSVLACQARLTGDAEIRFDPVPIPMKTAAVVRSVRDLAGEIVEVILEVTKPIPYLPGQYVKVEFAGFPARNYCPTLTLDGLREIHQLVFHIRRMEDGVVASALGTAIAPGRKVKVHGPFGHAFLRRGEGRIVLVSTGTGFAPVWSIAVAARLGQPHRPVTLVASVRDPRNLYMRPALDWLAKQGVTNMTLTASGANPLPPARHGRAIAFLPLLRTSDTVYACGDAGMIGEVREIALATGAKFYAQPFLPAVDAVPLRTKLVQFLTGKPKKNSPVHAQIEALSASLSRDKR